jgi:putative NADPH-quinone reductase
MKIMVILGHPAEGSFNHSIASTVVKTLSAAGHDVMFHDLYLEGFDPVLPHGEIPKGAELDPTIRRHCDEAASADGFVIVHPNWWGMPPAILKGWVDRVLRAGEAYKFVEGDAGEGIPAGLLKAKTAVILNTSNTKQEREQAVFGDPLETIWKNCIFGLCGVNDFHRKTYSVVVTSTPEQRKTWLKDVEDTINRIFPADL